MKTIRIISVILLVGIGLTALLGDLLDRDGTLGFVLSFIFIRFIGILLLYVAYLVATRDDFENDGYIDDDMDRLI